MLLPVVVCISGNGSNLQKLIDECHGKTIDIIAVVSDQPNVYGLGRATRAGIPALVWEQHKDQTRDEYCRSLITLIDGYSPKLVIFAGFMKIMTPNFVNTFTIVNIHPSLLPKFPGLDTHQRAIDWGETEHGITIHFVDAGVDTGPILWQAQCPIHPNDTAETLKERVHKLEHYWYPEIIDSLARQYDLTGDMSDVAVAGESHD